ncbi:SigB/SigF/SigG family RNA polymerase sigma factor [Streptomyces reniochalinae]|uniref:SigB/SigF/SigG family RNA polymerase sigma factor n=1 Tax=Streptomyces reniochalinae TaxID=2250578 RepID=A0A367EQF5_9ACTN|nr:SigB/SigF/SigG family RNA polymerase sigma factor [Streptomyces reniochalinae]
MMVTGLTDSGSIEAGAAGPSFPLGDPALVSPRDARTLTRDFLARLDSLEEGTREYSYVRDTLIEMNLSLVRYAASRFRSSGEEMDDIVQVGTIGLIKAIDRFQVSRELAFTTFAVPYIVGEIKRFFRDTTWAVHVPRRLQEARAQLVRAAEELRSRLDREPTVAELAALMSLPESEVVEAQKASNGYTTSSLDTTSTGDDDTALAHRIGSPDPALELVEDFHTLAPLISALDKRDRKLLHYRFVDELTQTEIGERLGVTQMHVSRLLNRLLGRLRDGMTPAGEPAPQRPEQTCTAAPDAPEAWAPPPPAPRGKPVPSSDTPPAASAGDDGDLVDLRQVPAHLPDTTLAALRWARANDPAFPAASGKRGNALLYGLGDLRHWAANRPRAGASGGHRRA